METAGSTDVIGTTHETFNGGLEDEDSMTEEEMMHVKDALRKYRGRQRPGQEGV
jgi:hypothetical protein